MSGPTCAEYWSEVKSLAADALEHERDGGDVSDWLHETIYGHQWVIYTSYHMPVLTHSPHHDAAWEEGLISDVGNCLSDVTEVAAFCALMADVNEALDTLRDEQDDTEDDNA